MPSASRSTRSKRCGVVDQRRVAARAHVGDDARAPTPSTSSDGLALGRQERREARVEIGIGVQAIGMRRSSGDRSASIRASESGDGVSLRGPAVDRSADAPGVRLCRVARRAAEIGSCASMHSTSSRDRGAAGEDQRRRCRRARSAAVEGDGQQVQHAARRSAAVEAGACATAQHAVEMQAGAARARGLRPRARRALPVEAVDRQGEAPLARQVGHVADARRPRPADGRRSTARSSASRASSFRGRSMGAARCRCAVLIAVARARSVERGR